MVSALTLIMKPQFWANARHVARMFGAAAVMFVIAASAARAADQLVLDLLKQPGHYALMRHAWAPFDGTPKGVTPRPDDCATQRNLDDKGRKQARDVGERLRAAGVTFDEIRTSPVCRCQETADLITGAKVQVLPAIDSFFRKGKALETERLTAFRSYLNALPPTKSGLYVTHGSYIEAMTGHNVDETVTVVIKRDGKGGFAVVAVGRP